MLLSSILSRDVNSDVQHRGRVYFRSGAVRNLQAAGTEVTAHVQGGTMYKVSLSSEERTLLVACDCAHAPSGICKHVWATVLAAESRGLLKALTESLGPLAEPTSPMKTTPRVPPPPRWREALSSITHERKLLHLGEAWPDRRHIHYVVDASSSAVTGQIILLLQTRELKMGGEGWNASKDLRCSSRDIRCIPDPNDREILGLLTGVAENYGFSSSSSSLSARREIRHPFSAAIFPLLCRTGRCSIQLAKAGQRLLRWDDGEPWQLELQMESSDDGNWKVDGMFRRAGESMDPSTPVLIAAGLVFANDTVARLHDSAPLEWIQHLRRRGRIGALREEGDALLAHLLELPGLPKISVPAELAYEEAVITPRPHLRIRQQSAASGPPTHFKAELSFDYDGRRFDAGEVKMSAFDSVDRRLIRRDLGFEASARQRLHDAGLRQQPATYYEPTPGWRLSPKKLPAAVRMLLQEGWRVDADGKLFRSAGNASFEVTSAMDWFELRGEVDYDGATAALPELLAALRRGDHVVQLSDGGYGLLPEQWLARFAAIADLGEATKDHVRFAANQTGLLDAMLAAQPNARFDEGFDRARQELKRFSGIKAAEQPAAFNGTLRDYQREGLGWMDFLRRFGFGGCLADDMGVGKTAQVLALLETRRELRSNANGSAGDAPSTSLVVAPRSLIFNWQQEAARFTPQLRVLDHTGAERNVEAFDNHDIILTTYGTLRRDVVALSNIQFDYVILDEAQAIKNAATGSAKAARLLKARHRLVLSGTPVENRLDDLWSLFEFLNPGMLGSGKAFSLIGASGRSLGDEARKTLAEALRPLILRRTKEQVARELPLKTEQTIYCELKPAQRKLYNELRDYYRASLLNRVDEQGMGKNNMHVLEALLRLRQAACHPGLIDKARSDDAGAKVDLLIDRLNEVIAEGHKALVFSQFTSLLAIVRSRLDASGAVYEYLDGQTRDRQARVERFQNDENCPLFLIGLKAGGLGLNLTAAEYVFLLDPWWNPAVEAQAIDRAHRIGQTRQVFAYRLIARDTVEEKVLELQNAKRDLAAAIIGEDNQLLRNLRREDLELLLS